MKRLIFLISSILTVLMCCAQSTSGLPVFQPPMDIPMEVAGNFMELRSDHFHSGLDFKTQGREGQVVKAAGDGWVSRIKISPWGYGKAVYIDHPNGYTTVYGHLSALSGAIGKAALGAQYKAERFDIDATFEKGQLPVTAGQQIALSGNTGGSSAPHLHFEVRRTSDQHALDPEAYGMHVPDRVKPTFLGVRIDPLDSSARTAPYPTGAKGFAVVAKNDSTYVLKDGSNPSAFGTVGLSVNVIDRYSNSSNQCGIRYLDVSVDGVPVFSIHLDDIDFAQQRYADCYMDYALFKANDLNYNRCYKQPNNKLAIYGMEAAQGRITVTPGKAHAIQLRATDANGNRSTLTFVLTGATAVEAAKWPVPRSSGDLFRYDQVNTLTKEGIRFTLPPNALYDNERLSYGRGPVPPKAYAPLHRLHDPLVPLQVGGDLSIAVTEAVDKALTPKLLIVRLDDKGKPSAIGGTYADGRVTAKIRSFGNYTVMLDTLPPTITSLDLKPMMTGKASFKLRIGDNLSGLDTWTGKLDGEWILLEYSPKANTLEHTFDSHSSAPGKHMLTVEATDERGNKRTFTQEFTR